MVNKKQLLLFFKGAAMGAADVVPGVSGGTIAYITGIYEELINSIKSFDLTAIKVWKQQGFKALWQHLNLGFLLTLFAGIACSILSLARLISWLLDTYPELLWSFFFGLILASGIFICRQVERWPISHWLLLALGVLIAWGVGELRPVEVEATPVTIFFAGAIAICAMILPGISGSFLLLLTGMYTHVINAIKSFDLAFVAVFATGCGLGLLAFSHLLSWLFRHYFDKTLSFLTGFLFGSLFLVWPWKNTTETYINSHGETVPLTRVNINPWDYLELTNKDPYIGLSMLFIAVAVVVVLLLEKLAGNEEES